MKRLLNFTGLLVWIGLMCYGIFYLFENFKTVSINILAVLGAVALIFIFIRLIYGKNWIINLGKQFFIGNNLIKATENFLGTLPKPSAESTANFLGHLVYRFTRLGMIGLLLATFPIWLLFNQNKLIEGQSKILDKQTELLKKQTIRLDQQTHLQEAQRRSSLVFLFSNIMDAIDRELKNDIGEKGKRDLSPQLVGRIIALSSRLKPYRYLDGDSLISKPLSPERGQLLVSLINSELDSNTYLHLFKRMDLKGADLKGADLVEADLRHANLNKANLRHANLNEANLSGTFLGGANLSQANLIEANMREAKLNGADLNKAGLIGADLKGAYLVGANLNGAYLIGVVFDSTLVSSNSLQLILEHEDIDFSSKYKVDTLSRDYFSGLKLEENYYQIIRK